MGQFISNFNTTAELQAFSGTTAFSMPHISLTKDDSQVHYFDPYAGHAYVEIGGLKWATMNVGANSITDTGLYFQWGDTQGYTADQVGCEEGKKCFDGYDYIYHNDGSFTKYNSTDGKTVLDLSDDAARANWGGSWRMPTTAEFQALGNAVNTAWTDDYQGSGVAGLVCTDKNDDSKVLFLPACGMAIYGSVSDVGSSSYYWSSSLMNTFGDSEAYYSYFDGYGVAWDNSYIRFNGSSVRGVLGA